MEMLYSLGPAVTPSVKMLLVCRQFYREASYISTHFVIKVEHHKEGHPSTQTQNPRFNSIDVWKNQYQRVRHIVLDLYWDFSQLVSELLASLSSKPFVGELQESENTYCEMDAFHKTHCW